MSTDEAATVAEASAALEGRLSVTMLADTMEGWREMYRMADGAYASLPEAERQAIEAGGLTDTHEALVTLIVPAMARVHPYVRAEVASTIGSAIKALRAVEAGMEAEAQDSAIAQRLDQLVDSVDETTDFVTDLLALATDRVLEAAKAVHVGRRRKWRR
jgi:hypothetical protein